MKFDFLKMELCGVDLSPIYSQHNKLEAAVHEIAHGAVLGWTRLGINVTKRVNAKLTGMEEGGKMADWNEVRTIAVTHQVGLLLGDALEDIDFNDLLAKAYSDGNKTIDYFDAFARVKDSRSTKRLAKRVVSWLKEFEID